MKRIHHKIPIKKSNTIKWSPHNVALLLHNIWWQSAWYNAAFHLISAWHLGLIEYPWWRDDLGPHSSVWCGRSELLRNSFKMILLSVRSSQPEVCLQCRQPTQSHSASASEQCSEFRGEECDNRMELREKLLHLRPQGMHQRWGWSGAFAHSG